MSCLFGANSLNVALETLVQIALHFFQQMRSDEPFQ